MSTSDFYQRRDDLARQLEADVSAGTLVFEHGWLVEVVNEHTCGTGANGYYGMHEPGCGRIPIYDVAGAIIRDEDMAGCA